VSGIELHGDCCEAVEGTIRNFHPKPAFGGYESFKVKDAPFFYSDYESTL
jgi:hypothetical protein